MPPVRLLSFVAACATCAVVLPSASAHRADAPPAGVAAQAFADVNANFRRPLALPDLSWDPLIANAAAAHVRYWQLSGFGSYHEETPGKPGFTGVGPGDRCQAAGATPYCGEVAYPQVGITDAVDGWLDTPYHGLPFFAYESFGCGWNKMGSVCDMDASSDPLAGVQVDWSAPVNTQAAPVRIWPYENDEHVPLTWTGGESPDPLEHYHGNKDDIGPTLFVGSIEAAAVSMRDNTAQKAVPLLAPDGASAASSLPVSGPPAYWGTFGWTAFFPAEKLTPNHAYTVTVSDSSSRSWHTDFKIPGLDPGLNVYVYTYDHAIEVDSADKTAVVTVTENGKTVAKQTVKTRGEWAWPGLRKGGTFVVCADVPQQGQYAAAHYCAKPVAIPVATDGLLKLGPIAVHGSTATLTIRALGPLAGVQARLHLQDTYRWQCGAPCGGWVHDIRKTLSLRHVQTITVPYVHSRDWALLVQISAPAFTRGGVHYSPIGLTKTLTH